MPVQNSTTDLPGNNPKVGLLHLPNLWGGLKRCNPSSIIAALTPSTELSTYPCLGAVKEYSNRSPPRMRRFACSFSLLTDEGDSAKSLERFA